MERSQDIQLKFFSEHCRSHGGLAHVRIENLEPARQGSASYVRLRVVWHTENRFDWKLSYLLTGTLAFYVFPRDNLNARCKLGSVLPPSDAFTPSQGLEAHLFEGSDHPLGSEWIWSLSAEDVYLASEYRTEDGCLNLRASWTGLSTVSHKNGEPPEPEMTYVQGEGPVVLSPSEWSLIAQTTGALPKSAPLFLSAAQSDPSWEGTAKAMQHAHDRLAHGRSGESLKSCFDMLENIVGGNPYQESVWRNWMTETLQETGSDARRDALVKLFSALGEVANKFGHHASQTKAPLDQWEAEIFVAMHGLGIAYLTRRVRELNQEA